ncbi:MAG: hypothetical protein QXO35_03795 [Candidatus Micrarchaeia archaeon]
MFESITYYTIFGKPFGAWIGILALVSIIITGLIAFLNKRGLFNINGMALQIWCYINYPGIYSRNPNASCRYQLNNHLCNRKE